MTDNKGLLEQVVKIAREAGDAIMEFYHSNEEFEVETKRDDGYVSPLTQADTAAHDIIEDRLERISEYPVVSEEGSHKAHGAKTFWLVDPLDGTKEFIKKNDEFTVNIALIEGNKPVLGVVLAPAKGLLYAAGQGKAPYKISDGGDKAEIKSEFAGNIPKVIASRSHRDERIDKLLAAIGEYEEVSMGSSLKLCLIAEGQSQIYPRLAPTYLWDTAAAHAIILAGGGRVRSMDGEELIYEPGTNLKNPFFVATTSNDTIFENNRDILKDI